MWSFLSSRYSNNWDNLFCVIATLIKTENDNLCHWKKLFILLVVKQHLLYFQWLVVSSVDTEARESTGKWWLVRCCADTSHQAVWRRAMMEQSRRTAGLGILQEAALMRIEGYAGVNEGTGTAGSWRRKTCTCCWRETLVLASCPPAALSERHGPACAAWHAGSETTPAASVRQYRRNNQTRESRFGCCSNISIAIILY